MKTPKHFSLLILIYLFLVVACTQSSQKLEPVLHPKAEPTPFARPQDMPLPTPTPPPTPTPTPTPTPPPTPISDGYLTGRVKSAIDASPLRGVAVSIRSALRPNTIVTTATTDGYGEYNVRDLAPGNYLVEFRLNLYIPISNVPTTISPGRTTTLDQSMSPVMLEGQYRIVLTWGTEAEARGDRYRNPPIPPLPIERDIDSYLRVPSDDEMKPISFSRYVGTGAKLDLDDTTYGGAETTTIFDPQAGKYIFYVHNFSGTWPLTGLGTSKVKVEVYKGAQLVKTYGIRGGEGKVYELFHIDHGQLIDVERYSRELCTYGDNPIRCH